MEREERLEAPEASDTLADVAGQLPDIRIHDEWLGLVTDDWNAEDHELLTQRVTPELIAHLRTCDECLKLIRLLRTLAQSKAFGGDNEWKPTAGLLTALEASATEDAAGPDLSLFAQVCALDGEDAARACFPIVALHLDVCTACRETVAAEAESLMPLAQPAVPTRQSMSVRNQGSMSVAATVVSFLQISARALTSAVRATRVAVAYVATMLPLQPASSETTPSPRSSTPVLWTLETASLRTVPGQQLVVLNAPTQTPWWLEVPRSLYQLWTRACTVLGNRLFLDVHPLLAVRHEDDAADDLVLLLPDADRHLSLSIALAPLIEREAWKRVETISWDNVLSSHLRVAMVPPGLTSGPSSASAAAGLTPLRLRPPSTRPSSRLFRWQLPFKSGPEPGETSTHIERPAWTVSDSLTGNSGTRIAEGLVYYAVAVLHDIAGLDGSRAHLEEAIAYYEQALHFFPPSQSPIHYALTKRRLASTYLRRAADSREEDSLYKLTAAMFEEVADLFQRNACPVDAAECTVNRANVLAWMDKERHTVADRAIPKYQEALRVLTFDEHPIAYAAAQMNLGLTYAEQGEARHDRTLIERAIACYREALRVFTVDHFETQFGLVQHRLGLAYQSLASISPTLAIQDHFDAYAQALRVFNPDRFPVEHAALQLSLGRAYLDRAGGNHRAAQASKRHLQSALKVYVREAFPHEHREAHHLLAELEAKRQQPPGAGS